jgi:hypothetical protein
LDVLKAAAGDSPIISITRTPLDLGLNLLDTAPKSFWNLYMQILRGAQAATTPYVALAEDDILYTREHFTEFRPALDQVSYDRSRWSLFTWEPHPIYCLRQRISNCSLVASREYLIDALEERKRVWPDGVEDARLGEVGRPIVDRRLHVTPRQMVEWYSTNPIVQLNHPAGSDSGDYGKAPNGRHLVKKHGQIKAVEIPGWGRAADLAAHYVAD